MKKCSYSKGFVAGAIIGAIGALLLAPQSGKKTRKVLSETFNKKEDILEETKDAAEDLIYRTKKSIEDSIDKLTQTIEQKEHDESNGNKEFFNI